MEKQEQIEEMAKEIFNSGIAIQASDLAYGLIDNDDHFHRLAKYLYAAGYRKTFTSDLASDTQKAFKEGYVKGIEEQKAEIERLKAENASRQKAIESFISKKCYLKCAIAKTLVKEFAEQLKERYVDENLLIDGYFRVIDELLKTYGLDGKVNGINLRLGITQKDFEIIITALREYAKNHPNPKCHANEANDIAHLIEYQRRKIEE